MCPAWRLHTNLEKFKGKVSPQIFPQKKCCDLNLGEHIYLEFFLFSDSGPYLVNGYFILIYFEQRDTENQLFLFFYRKGGCRDPSL